MAYYLTDPYYYLPKSYPFHLEYMKSPDTLSSNRETDLGRDIESMTATTRLEFESKIFHDSAKCEQRLLKCKYSAMRMPNANSIAEIQANRRSKEQALRARGHRFPNFIKNQSLIEEYKHNSERVKMGE